MAATNPEVRNCMQALRSACIKVRLVAVADGLAALSVHAQQELPSLLAMLCPPLCAAFFPRSSRWLLRATTPGHRASTQLCHMFGPLSVGLNHLVHSTQALEPCHILTG